MNAVAPIRASPSPYFVNDEDEEQVAPEHFDIEQNNNNLHADFYQQINFGLPTERNPVEHMRLTKEDLLLLEKSSVVQKEMRKSHSYTQLQQEKLNERVATSLTGDSVPNCDTFTYILEMSSENCFGNAQLNSQTNYFDDNIINYVVFPGDAGTFSGSVDMDEKEEALLMPDSMNSYMSRGKFERNYSKPSLDVSGHSSLCFRVYAYITRNWYLNYLVPVLILLALMFVAYLTRDYAKHLLYWIETQNPWVIFATFLLLFVVVSFPVVVGYFVLMITSGYLLGFFKGLFNVIIGANVGIAFAHATIRCFRHRIPLDRLIKNETGLAILRVISGPRAFKVVLFTRLTPIPFGLQNAIFGVSSINSRTYHLATLIGLLPAQIINAYLGSTLRSMHEVLNSHGTVVTSYISFAIETVCGVALMFWVVQKARKELSETLLSCSEERKPFDIQV